MTDKIKPTQLDFDSLDMAERPYGTLKLAEFHFPCDFVHHQQSCRIDIAGHRIEHLASKVS